VITLAWGVLWCKSEDQAKVKLGKSNRWLYVGLSLGLGIAMTTSDAASQKDDALLRTGHSIGLVDEASVPQNPAPQKTDTTTMTIRSHLPIVRESYSSTMTQPTPVLLHYTVVIPDAQQRRAVVTATLTGLSTSQLVVARTIADLAGNGWEGCPSEDRSRYGRCTWPLLVCGREGVSELEKNPIAIAR
jgi:hypothetical protein